MISEAVYKYSGLPSEKVIGTGTFLDSIRLAYYLSDYSGFNASDFKTLVLGEHGDTQVPIFSHCTLKGKPIIGHKAFKGDALTQITEQTKTAAFEIRKTQGGTTYGVSKCAEMLFNYLVTEGPHHLSLSVLTNKHYQSLLNFDHDIYFGLPVTIQKGKIMIDNSIKLSNQELSDLGNSARLLASLNDQYFLT